MLNSIRRLATCMALVAVMMFQSGGFAVSGDSSEHMSMVMRRAAGTEVISSDIALRLAELIFVRHYGKDVTDAQLPLTIIDHKDRWEVKGDKVDIPGQRVKVVIIKADGRIVELYGW